MRHHEEGDESEAIGPKGQCPCDDPSSSFQTYSDGHGFCFAGGCPHPMWSAAKLAKLGWEVPEGADLTEYHPRREGAPRMSEDLEQLIASGEVKAIESRKLSQSTCRHWDYRIRLDPKTGTPQHIAIYKDEHGVPVAAKVRNPDKSFFVVGTLPPLYGMQFLRNGGKKVIVTEGEIDCLTVSQLWGNKFPVVSLPKGAGPQTKTTFPPALEWLVRFDEVVLCFDMDAPGRDTMQMVAKMLPPGKAYMVSLPRKDPSEMATKGETDQLMTALLNPVQYRPDGIVSGASLIERAKKGVGWGLTFGMPYLDNLQWGWRDGEVIVCGAGTGMGKTDLEMQIAAHILMVEKQPVALFNYEASPERTLLGIAGKHARKRFTDPDQKDVTWTEDDLDKALEEVTRDGRLYINDHFGKVDWDSVKERHRFLVHGAGVKRTFVDPVAALAAGEEDERHFLDFMFADAKALNEELHTGMWFNSHLARPAEGKSHEEGGRVTLRNFRGSGAIGMWPSMVIGMERNQQAEDPTERRTTVLRSLKVREAGEKVGEVGRFLYNAINGMVEPVEPSLLQEEDPAGSKPPPLDMMGIEP